MKQTLFYLMIVFTAGIFSCKKMDSTYREYVVPDGITYPQKAGNLRFYSGLNRAKLTWNKPTDPRVAKARIYWNNYTDSVNLDIPTNKDTVVYVFDRLEEGMYTFFVVTYDADNNASVPVEISGSVYGPNYLSALSSRSLSDPFIYTGIDGEVKWGGAPENLVYSEIRYKTNNAGTQTIRVPMSESQTLCPDVKRKELFEYRSAFLPPASIDTFYTVWTTFKTPFYIKYDKSDWTASGSSQLAGWGDGKGSGNEGGYPRQTIDGDLASAWHSDPGRPLPHWIMVNMVSPRELHHVDLFLHPSYQYAQTVQVFVSDVPDEAYWELSTEFTFPAGVGTSVYFPENTVKQYLIIKFTDSKVGQYSNLAEINVYGL